MKGKKKLAVLILYYDCEQFILRTISNCGEFVDKIYVSYSPEPWIDYNRDARKFFKNQANPNILSESEYINKIELVSGIWKNEEDQRNECLTKAKESGFDFLIVQDADEFYTRESYSLNITEMLANPEVDIFQTRWVIFWKNLNYVVLEKGHLYNGNRDSIYGICQVFAINLKKDVLFWKRRVPKDIENVNKRMLGGLCLHLSYILSDEEVLAKINTWGHSHQVRKNWYNYKWLAWTPKTKFINPIDLLSWKKAVAFNGDIPAELKTFKLPEQIFKPVPIYQMFLYSFLEIFAVFLSSLTWQIRQVRIKFKLFRP